jgi:hypothetical protein
MATKPRTLNRTRFWAPWTGPGLEHLRPRVGDIGYVAAGTVLGLREGVPFRLQYKIKTDWDWRVRKIILELHTSEGNRIQTLRTDGRGHWRNDDGEPLPAFEGCLDVDISATPFTNTLPIRRLDLRPGQRADLRVVYVPVPSLAIRAVAQRYTGVERHMEGGIVTYEGLFRDFRADLPFDADGLVFDYPETFRRVHPA